MLLDTLDSTRGDLLAQTHEQLRGFDAAPPGRCTRTGSTAGFVWVDAEQGPKATSRAEAVKPSLAVNDGAELCLVVSDTGARLRAAFVYDSGLFRRATIERFAGHLGVVLAGFAGRLDAPIAEIPLLTSAERQWLEAMGDGRSRALSGNLVHQEVEHHAATTPDAVAVRYRDQHLTYAELNVRANRLSRYLVAEGVGSESLVGVCVEPGLYILVALLAILKAGAAYVPLDPAYPALRLRTIVDDTRPSLVITSLRLSDGLKLGDVPVFTIDDPKSLEKFSGENVAVAIDREQAATVFHTSGTTGKPKGVVATHSNLASYVAVARERYQVGRRDVVPAIARFSFSISLFELLVPLAAGGTLLVLDRDHVLTPARMAETLREVTLFHAGPSLLRGLIAYIKRHYTDFGAFSGVRHASSGGDMVPPDLLEGMKEVFPNAEVFVIYGCSEISCMGCTHAVPRDRLVEKTFVGRPFDDMSVRVLDPALRLLPVGVVGEICFSGSGVVRGYLNRPDLTEEKFVLLQGRRFYRTGDMGRVSEDGSLEILGRRDFQVKVRGMRIELGEVEHHLRRAPGVREGVVMARQSAHGETILVAYVVVDAADVVSAASTERARTTATRRHMTEHVPDYMVPAIYVELGSLPLNHNMKVDRHALPDPGTAVGPGPGDARSIRPPETPTESFLASVWKRLLGVEDVGLDDNFFELGGFSLLALGLIHEVDAALGVTLDGMDVLRESLEVQARTCDERLGTVVDRASSRTPSVTGALARPASKRPTDVVELFHFGAKEELYGVLRRPLLRASGDEAVLICAPVGQEQARAHFVLKRLAGYLVDRGISVLQFDYYGCGDSLGDSVDGSCTRWQRDITDALAELRRRGRGTRVTAVGARLGATLLWDMVDRLDVARLVFWDPICDGSAYAKGLAAMHGRHLAAAERPWFRPWATKTTTTKWRHGAKTSGTELCGSTYSDVALAELRSLSMVPRAAPGIPINWLATSPSAPERAASTRILGTGDDAGFQALDVDCAWQDVARLEDMLPDVGISRTLAEMTMEGP